MQERDPRNLPQAWRRSWASLPDLDADLFEDAGGFGFADGGLITISGHSATSSGHQLDELGDGGILGNKSVAEEVVEAITLVLVIILGRFQKLDGFQGPRRRGRMIVAGSPVPSHQVAVEVSPTVVTTTF